MRFILSHLSITDRLPFDIIEGIDGVVLTEHPGWNRDLASDTYEGLPTEVRNYLTYLEQQIALPVIYVSTGPGREELIVR